ncbi:pyridoxamine 5'-phosphate oxidase family protein [Fulvivirga sp. M361]|uniref:pyridoxamine 5'-phosphate oxidase family protein n=1 Tax=Fulvivirga sp. M361 TaxID=2594266 RepID=UPI001629E4F0|nr:pyridoxamine 5'-phosphate oxidase family protein [Fulvivirga sp. M361]
MNEELRIQLVMSKMGMITYLADDGSLTMGVAMIQSVSASEIRLFTYLENVIASELERRPNLVLTVQDTEQELFLAVSGEASVEEDDELAAKLWNENNGNWFETKETDKHVFLINLAVTNIYRWPSD